MSDGSKSHKKSGKTGSIHQAPAGYKEGGAVMCHAEGGHTSMSMRSGEHGHKKMDCSPMKMGGSTSTKSKKNY
jgi:hypothetical protein